MPLKYVRLLFFIFFLVILGWFIAAIKAILLPFVFGILIAYLFDPLADRLERLGLSRALSATVVLLTFFLVLGLAMLLLMPPLIEQVASLIAHLPAKLTLLEKKAMPILNRFLNRTGVIDMEDLQAASADMSQKLLATSGGMAAAILRSGLAIADLVALMVIAPVVSFYLLRDFDILVAKLDALLPRYYAETIREHVREINRVISAFLRGQLNVCLALAIFYAVALSIAQLKYALLVGLLSGVLIVIPYVGAIIGGILSVGIAYVQSDGDPKHIGIIFGIYMLGHVLEGYVLTPRLMGKSLGLHPIWIIFGMLAGGTLLGFTGVLIAVPVTAVIGVLVRSLIRVYLASPLYSSAFIRPEPVVVTQAQLPSPPTQTI